MITVPDPTPEERMKMLRSQRFSLIGHALLTVASLTLAAFELWIGRRADYVYVALAIGFFGLITLLIGWRRAKKYA